MLIFKSVAKSTLNPNSIRVWLYLLGCVDDDFFLKINIAELLDDLQLEREDLDIALEELKKIKLIKKLNFSIKSFSVYLNYLKFYDPFEGYEECLADYNILPS